MIGSSHNLAEEGWDLDTSAKWQCSKYSLKLRILFPNIPQLIRKGCVCGFSLGLNDCVKRIFNIRDHTDFSHGPMVSEKTCIHIVGLGDLFGWIAKATSSTFFFNFFG